MKRKRSRRSQEQPSPGEVQEQALARCRALLPAQEYTRLLEELQRPLRMAIRLNPLKVNPSTALEDWTQRYGWQVEPVPYCDTGWWVTGGTPISKTLEHRLGYYYIQDAASMLPVELFAHTESELLILDMAASPGGKTTHLVSKVGDRGLIIANDSSSERITALRLVLQDWGTIRTAVTQFPGERFGVWYPDTFDRVLLDAPCSMENLRSTESHPMRSISPSERTQLAKRQLRLLENALKAVKTGGQIVYSTCTLAPEEDEAVLTALLERHPNAVRVENVEDRLPLPAPGLLDDGTHRFSPQVQHAVRLFPHRYGTSGFFAALLTKLNPIATDGKPLPPPARSLAQAGLAVLTRKESTALADQLEQVYGFNLPALLQSQELALWRRGARIYAFPDIYLRRVVDLPCRYLGMEVGEETPGSFIPSHEWVVRFTNLFHTGHCRLEHEYVTAWLRGEDIHGSIHSPPPVGQMVIVEDEQGRLLGRGKQLSNRLKNLLPPRLVLQA